MISFNKIKLFSKKYIYLILTFLIIIIICFLFNNLYKKDTKEHYLTYFLPYYDNEKNKIQNFYLNEDYKRMNYKKYFYYEPFNFGYHIKERIIIVQALSKLLLANSKLKNCNDVRFRYDQDLIKNLNKDKIQLAIMSIPAIAYYNSNSTKEDDPINVKLVLKVSQRYVFFITRNNTKIDSLTKFPLKCKIGTNRYKLNEKTQDNFITIEILDYLKYVKDKDYFLKSYVNFNDAGQALINNEVDLLVWIDLFPNEEISNFVNKYANTGLRLLPFIIPQEKVFTSTYYQYDISYIDLNLFSDLYLPVKFGKQEYNNFKPDLKILKFDEYLVTNRFVNKDIIYNITDSYFEYVKVLDRVIPEFSYFIRDIELDNKQIPISYHEGARKYYYDKGVMTNNPNPNCRYLAGVMECNDKTLADHGLTYYS